MPGFTKSHPKREFGRAFPSSRYDDPRGGQPSALERNVLRYRAVEATPYLFYDEKARDFMLTSVLTCSPSLQEEHQFHIKPSGLD